ncbi:Netrin-G1 [Labeo rohita]|uniref:Netrin-G1 n=1 Tax=Labeo rohita TaxID=84645 RepID=A0ABQ8MX96_LABRO|nr:Netrin-G1 [Labeo rohita]
MYLLLVFVLQALWVSWCHATQHYPASWGHYDVCKSQVYAEDRLAWHYMACQPEATDMTKYLTVSLDPPNITCGDPPEMYCALFGLLGYTIMGKTADLTVDQKTITDTLHNEGKPQTFTAKEAGCSQSAVSKHVNKVEWKEKPLLNHTQHQRRLTWAKEKKKWTVAQWSKVLFSDESKFCISFGNQRPRVWRKRGEAHSPSCLKSSVKFPQSVMIWGAMSSAANSPDLNPIENLWGIIKRKMRNKRPKNADELKATVKETWASIPPQQCHRLITSMPH